MADNPITGVLSLLRLLKHSGRTPGNAVIDHVKSWIGDGATDAQVARVYAYANDLISAAEEVVRHSQLNEEAQQGLFQTTSALRNTFLIQNAGTALQTFLPTLEAAITTFSILASATGLTNAARPQEIDDLIRDVETMAEAFETAEIDPLVKETAKRHLVVLATMLRNIDAFGVDGAMAAYFELIVRLQRATKTASPATAAKVAKYWPEVERWAGRLAVIEGAVNHGQTLLGHVGHMVSLLPHLASIAG